MEDHKCPFNSTLITNEFGCRNARPVARRGGPDVACTNTAAHGDCEQLFAALKSAALPAFDVEDDLLTMPHSVLVKIQYGGLLGLQRCVSDDAVADVARIEDISALVEQAITKYGNADDIPGANLVTDMTGFRLRRRRG